MEVALNPKTSDKKPNGIPSITVNGKIEEKFLAEVVHKIKNNLGGIGGFASLLERDLEGDDSRLKLVYRIQESVERLNNFVIHLMGFVRHSRPRNEKAKVFKILEETWATCFEEDEENCQLPSTLRQTDKSCIVNADSHFLHSIFFHTIQFVTHIGGQIKAVDSCNENGDSVEVNFHFSDKTLPQNLPGDINRLIEVATPVEAKLSLAIVMRMTDAVKGSVSFSRKKGDHKILSIGFLKGN